MYVMKQLLFETITLKIYKHFFSIRDAQNIEEIRRQKNEDGPPSDSGVTKNLSGCLDNISLGRGVTIQESSGAYILPQDSQVVKPDDKMNEDEEGIMLSGDPLQLQQQHSKRQFLILILNQNSSLVQVLEGEPGVRKRSVHVLVQNFPNFLISNFSTLFSFNQVYIKKVNYTNIS